MLGKALPHTNKQFNKNLGGAWGWDASEADFGLTGVYP